MAEELAIARWSGVTSVGNEKWPDGNLVIRGIAATGKGSVVVQTPDERYRELFVAGTAPGTLQHRAAPSDEVQRIGTFGDNKITNCALWVRSAGSSRLSLPKDDTGIFTSIVVSDLGATGISPAPVLDTSQENLSIFGGPFHPISRVWIKSAPGTPSGFILQSPNRTPWVIWVNQADELKVTTWENFRLGV